VLWQADVRRGAGGREVVEKGGSDVFKRNGVTDKFCKTRMHGGRGNSQTAKEPLRGSEAGVRGVGAGGKKNPSYQITGG